MSETARQRFETFRKSLPRPPRLERRIVHARGLDFAVWLSPDTASAPPLVCVNGGMLYSHALLWPALSPLAVGRQIILYDQRGRGATQAPPALRNSRIEYDAGDLGAIREALGIARWDMLGHSWGGGIAMLAAERDALGVRRLVTANAVGATNDWVAQLHTNALARLEGTERAALAALDPHTLHADDPAIHAEYSRAIYPAYFADREFGRGFAPPREASATGAAIAARLRRDGYDWREPIKRITATALVVHGTQDILPPRLATELVACIPRATLQFIDGAGHMPFWEQPELFFRSVIDFLDSKDRGI